MGDISLIDINEVVDIDRIEKAVKKQVETIEKLYYSTDDKNQHALGKKLIENVVTEAKFKYGFNFVSSRLVEVAEERDEWKLKCESAKKYMVDHGANIREIDKAISNISSQKLIPKDKAAKLRSVLFEKVSMESVAEGMEKLNNLKK